MCERLCARNPADPVADRLRRYLHRDMCNMSISELEDIADAINEIERMRKALGWAWPVLRAYLDTPEVKAAKTKLNMTDEPMRSECEALLETSPSEDTDQEQKP